jgi:hypothetical protein
VQRQLQGHYVRFQTGEEAVQSFVPRPLPPEPPVEMSAKLCDLLERANRAVGRLDGVATLLPDPTLFLYTYVRGYVYDAYLRMLNEGT